MPPRGRSASLMIGLGILLSKIAGLVRQRVFAAYFSTSFAADAFNAAFRIPNLLQNLFGEGALSASFIPGYSRLVAEGRKEDASRLAAAVVSLLVVVSTVIVLVGVLAAPALVDLIAPGFEGERRDLTIKLTRIFFPGAGLLVLSAWCLGILNSHRHFFLSYAAPVIWNAAMIAALVGFGQGRSQTRLAEILAWASVVGSALQFAIQLPAVLRIVGQLRLTRNFSDEGSRTVVRNFVPAFFSRGVVQISAFVDQYIASWLVVGSVATLGYAQMLYILPVSLFGMSVSAAELPAMSSATGTVEEIALQLRIRLDLGLRRIAFFVIPSAIAFIAIGDMVAASLYETGRFSRSDSLWVWIVLAGSTIGLLPSTWGRLYSSAYFALGDTRTPLRFAIVRVSIATALGLLLALGLPKWIPMNPRVGVAGVTAASGIAALIEFILLRNGIDRKIGRPVRRRGFLSRVILASLGAAAAAWGAKLALHGAPGSRAALMVVLAFALAYGTITTALGLSEARAVVLRVLRRG